MAEKYLSISVLGQVNLKAFKNRDKTPDNKQPDFKGDGVAVWIYEKKEKAEPKQEEDF